LLLLSYSARVIQVPNLALILELIPIAEHTVSCPSTSIFAEFPELPICAEFPELPISA